MRNKLIYSAVLGVIVMLTSTAASAHPFGAHPFGAHGAGLIQGLVHPLTGIDHLLAMIAVGMWAVHAAGRKAWAIPLAFVLATAAGAALAVLGVHVPMVEPGIAASVIVLGLLLAFMVKMPALAGAALVALFAVFHGHAHGLELSLTTNPWMYGIGFLATTASLHALGMSIAWFCKEDGARWLRVSGAAMASIGVLMLVTT